MLPRRCNDALVVPLADVRDRTAKAAEHRPEAPDTDERGATENSRTTRTIAAMRPQAKDETAWQRLTASRRFMKKNSAIYGPRTIRCNASSRRWSNRRRPTR